MTSAVEGGEGASPYSVMEWDRKVEKSRELYVGLADVPE